MQARIGKSPFDEMYDVVRVNMTELQDAMRPRARLQTQTDLLDFLQKASPEQRERARRMTYNVQQCVRPDALLAERDVLELIEAMLIQVEELGSVDQV